MLAAGRRQVPVINNDTLDRLVGDGMNLIRHTFGMQEINVGLRKFVLAV